LPRSFFTGCGEILKFKSGTDAELLLGRVTSSFSFSTVSFMQIPRDRLPLTTMAITSSAIGAQCQNAAL
jgi:hypothetical protein